MYTMLQQELKRAGTWQLVVLTVVSSVIITIGLSTLISYLGWGRVSLEVLVIGIIDASVVPLIVAPLLIKLVKQNIDLEELIQALQQEITVRKRAEAEARQQAESLLAVNQLAIECAAAGPDTPLEVLIADKLAEITGAMAVSLSTYESDEQALTLRYLAVPATILARVNQLLGRNLIGLKMPVSPEMFEQMLYEVATISEDLWKITLGAIPKPVAALIQTTFGIGSFTALALNYGGELVGTIVVVKRSGQPPLNPDLAQALANVASVSLRRKKAEEALGQSEQKFRNIAEQIEDVIFVTDQGGVITYISPSSATVFGWPAEEMINRPFPEFLATVDVSLALTQFRQAITSGQKQAPLSLQMKRKDGTDFIGELRANVIQQDGLATGTIGIILDITARKQAEAEREKLITELAAKNTELERFTYTVSHDLKSPLITINGFLSWLEKDIRAGEFDRVKADTNQIREASNKMQRLLDELLELSRIGRLMNPPEEVPFETIVREALKLVEGRLAERGMAVEVAEDLPVIYGDRARLVEVVQNLVDNAAKYVGDQCQPHIEIGLREQNGEPVFFVEDNGKGIESKFHQKVFDLFGKLDTGSEGTGIGLTLVKRIVEIHGGRIWVESEGNNKGSTFCFTLPLAAEVVSNRERATGDQGRKNG
jgi:PAS domain S-box-containing protein